MTDERALDAALSIWAKADAGDDASVARIVSSAGAFAEANPRMANPRETRSPRRWWPILMGGGAIAASIAVAITLLSPAGEPAASPGSNQGVQLASASDPAVDSFAMLYTVSDEEEYYL